MIKVRNGTDRYYPKVHCPQCNARLLDIRSDDLEYSAIIEQMGNRDQFDFSIKCPKCKSIVGITFERRQAQIKFRTASGVPAPVMKTAPMPQRIAIIGTVSV